jgi:hypothetical protein
MAKSDLLKQAIADANAVRETAIANAKIALQEAFAPRIQSMLSAKLSEELEDEFEDEMDDMEMGDTEMEMGDTEMEIPSSVNVGVDFDGDGSYDLEGEVGSIEDDEMEMDDEMDMDNEMDMDDEMDFSAETDELEDDLELESILRELEEGIYEEEMETEEVELAEDIDIDSIIEAILQEEMDDEHAGTGPAAGTGADAAELRETKRELSKAYKTVKQLNSVINEVNLLNAKLLYTNKLFRNFDLNESQKMKVIENFDRASTTREVKLVYGTLSESFVKPTNAKKRIVKESAASKPVATTAPSRTVLNEGFELADRWKKLAGLL